MRLLWWLRIALISAILASILVPVFALADEVQAKDLPIDDGVFLSVAFIRNDDGSCTVLGLVENVRGKKPIRVRLTVRIKDNESYPYPTIYHELGNAVRIPCSHADIGEEDPN